MTALKDYLKPFIMRRNVARAKVASGYRPEYFKGVADTYDEVLQDLAKVIGVSE